MSACECVTARRREREKVRDKMTENHLCDILKDQYFQQQNEVKTQKIEREAERDD